MKNRVINAIKRIASSEYVHKYFVNGTKEEYVIPEELIDLACSEAESVFRIEILRNIFNSKELEALKRFAILGREIEKKISFDEYVIEKEKLVASPLWNDLQIEACRCLKTLGITDVNSNID